MLSADVVESLDELGPLRAQWDALATALRRPFAAPEWLLPWWRHLAPARSALRIVAVADGGRLVGLAPCFLQSRRLGPPEHRLLGGGFSHRVAPLIADGRAGEVVPLIARSLARSAPGAIRLEGVDASGGWAARIARAWPAARSPAVRVESTLEAPVLTLAGRSYDAWLASKSANFRQGLRRLRRRFDEEGVEVRLAATLDEACTDLAAFEALHRSRWATRGGSALAPSVRTMLEEAARGLLEQARIRVFSAWAGERPVCAQVFVAAGGEVAYWNGGFDESWGRFSPGVVTLLAAVEDAFGRGEARMDFGGGDDHYKRRFADGSDPLAWTTLYPHGGTYAAARIAALPRQARRRARVLARRYLAPEVRWRAKRLLPRRPAHGSGGR